MNKERLVPNLNLIPDADGKDFSKWFDEPEQLKTRAALCKAIENQVTLDWKEDDARNLEVMQ